MKHSSVLGSDTRILKVKHIHFQTRKRQTLLSQHNRVYHRSAHEQQELIYFTCRTSNVSSSFAQQKYTRHTHMNILVASHYLKLTDSSSSDTFTAQCACLLNSNFRLKTFQYAKSKRKIKHFTSHYLSQNIISLLTK